MNSASTHELVFEAAAVRDLKRLPREQVERVMSRILSLRDDPRPAGVRKISGSKSDWRIRIGSYRVIYHIDDAAATVAIMRVRTRDRAYD